VPTILTEALSYFENAIYLPMLTVYLKGGIVMGNKEKRVEGEISRIVGIGTVRSVGTLNLEKLVERLLKSSIVYKT